MTRALAAVLLAFLSSPAVAQHHRSVVQPPPRTAAELIAARGIPFATVEAIDDDRDLLPLREVIRDTPYVGVGEATHGTHEFFAMKHRLFRFLAERIGFTVFAIEASLPECDKINDYVRTGAGDPSALVAGMHFWTWNVDEVLDLVLWMRSYNVAHPEAAQLSFRGFDLQFSQMAIAEINAYVTRIDPGTASTHAQRLSCADRSYSAYQALSAAARNACRDQIAAEYTAFGAARAQYVAASSEAEYERMLRYARVVVQFEDLAGHAPSATLVRDRYMAENAEWIAESEQPGEKMMLWAHNFHISSIGALSMGTYLFDHWRTRYLRMGFLFDSGDFNAIDAATSKLQIEHIDAAPDSGFEAFFRPARQPRLIVDLRNPPANVATELFAAHTYYTIGAVFPPSRQNGSFPSEFDVAIWISQSTPSRLRPF